MRIGIGYDVHKLVYNRPLIIGGVKIPSKKGLLGHSDADVLIHSIVDSILGALSIGDIGTLFPDNEICYKNIRSDFFLKKVNKIMKKKGYYIVNIDSIVIAQKIIIRPYVLEIIKNISSILDIKKNKVSVKATTEEGLGFTGENKGVAAKSVILLEEINKKNENI